MSTATAVLNGKALRQGLEKNDFTLCDRWVKELGMDHHCGDGSTLLSRAATQSSLQVVDHLIKKGANVNFREKGGASPLLLAIHFNRLEIVQGLVKSGADVNLKDSYDDTPLTAAVREGNLEIVRVLTEYGANVSACDVQGTSPLFRAMKENKVPIVDFFLSKETGKDSVSQRLTTLVAAVKSGYTLEIIKCILKYVTDLNVDENGKTPLAWASEVGNLEVAKILLEKGANINMLSLDGNTALATAVRQKRMDVAKYLTTEGANVCKFGEKGKTPLLWAILNEDLDMINLLLDHGSRYIIDSVFLDAIATENLNVVQLLKERGATSDNEETTPLMKALKVGNVEIAKYLINKGANVVRDLGGKEISEAITFFENGNSEMVKLLLESGARLDEWGDCGETLLTKATLLEDLDMVKYLLAKGAKVDQANQKDSTPLAIAEANNDFKIFQYLVDCGAKVDEDEKTKNPKLYKHYQIAKGVKQVFGSNQESAED